MELFSKEELIEYVKYWGGDVNNIDQPIHRRGRSLSAEIFYCLHSPQDMPKRPAWERTVKQAVTFLWDRLHREYLGTDVLFRTKECKEYFKELL